MDIPRFVNIRDSEYLVWVGYFPENNVMIVRFSSGQTVMYENVHRDIFADIVSAPSAGKEFSAYKNSGTLEDFSYLNTETVDSPIENKV